MRELDATIARLVAGEPARALLESEKAHKVIAALHQFVTNPTAHRQAPFHKIANNEPITPADEEPHAGATVDEVVLSPFHFEEVGMDTEPKQVAGKTHMYTNKVRVGLDGEVVDHGGRLYEFWLYKAAKDLFLKMRSGNIDWWFKAGDE